MPINVYSGLQGSGKSYEVVSFVILSALSKGRRVVTNVDGIDNDNCRAYVHEKMGIDLAKVGHVVHCTNDRILQDNFFPQGVAGADTFVQPGDLVAVDECWRFWAGDSKISHEHRVFFREHRHYCHPETKVSCDLVCMTQDIGDLNRLLKAVVELSFRTTKIKSLGMNKTYRIEMWEGWKQSAKARISVEVKKYKPEIFPLYSSYVGGKGNEVQVDSRQNILRKKTIWMFAAGALVAFSLGTFTVYRFFHQSESFAEKERRIKAASGIPVASASSPSGISQPGQSASPIVQAPPAGDSPTDRIVGTYTVRGQTYVLLATGNTYRPEHPSMIQREGMMQVITEGAHTVRRFEMSKAPK